MATGRKPLPALLLEPTTTVDLDDYDASCVFLDLHVQKVDEGRRADVWLRTRLPQLSRTQIVRLIREHRVSSHQRPLKPSTTLQAGEVLRLRRPGLVPDSPPPPLPEVLYEDDRLLALNKPAGLLVHPAGPSFVWSLIAVARRNRPGVALHLGHRLDRDTSGVVIMGKDAEANRHLKKAFREQRVQKSYLAICRGEPAWKTYHHQGPIGDDATSEIRLKMGVVPGGSSASTEFTVEEMLEGGSLVSCRPHTGRTHQIRVHLDDLGHPLVGDRIYGQPDSTFLHIFAEGFDDWALERVALPRHALHAKELVLPHPDDDRPTRILAPLADDLKTIVQSGRVPSPPGEPR
jgi:23S rRNA pseudouridine1911/1915/1917 synthase